MSSLSRRKIVAAAEPEESDTPGATKKIVLNFRRYTSQQARELATATLDATGFDPSIADAKVGDRMPDGTIYAGKSPDTGKPMYTTPVDAPKPLKWKKAMGYAKNLEAHGHNDWRLPTKGELNVLFNSRTAIGGLKLSGSGPADWYWSGTQSYIWFAWGQLFSDGWQRDTNKGHPASVRCVR